MPPADNTHAAASYHNQKRPRRALPIIAALALGLLILLILVVFFNMLRPKPLTALSSDYWTEAPQTLQPAQTGGAGSEDSLSALQPLLADHPELAPVFENPAAYPAGLIDLAARNPEAISFLLGWPGHVQPAGPADISSELAAGGVPAFYQWDSRWGYAAYAGGMIGLDGCGPVCLSMAAVGLTANAEYDPLSLARLADAAGHSDPAYGTSWSLMTEGAAALGLSGSELPLDENALRGALEAGSLVILSVRPGNFTTTGHFVLVAGIRPDGSFTVHDPNSMANTSKSWTYEQLAPQIKNLWAVSA